MSHTPTLLAYNLKYLFLVDWVATKSVWWALFEFDLSLFFDGWQWFYDICHTVSHHSQHIKSRSIPSFLKAIMPLNTTWRDEMQRKSAAEKITGNFCRCDMGPQNYIGMSLGKVLGVKFAKWGSWVTSVLVKVGSELLSVERQWVVTLFMVGVLLGLVIKVSSSRRNLLERWTLCLKCDKIGTVSDLKGCMSLSVSELLKFLKPQGMS